MECNLLFNFYRVHKYLYIHLRLVLQVYMQCLAIRRRWWKVFYVVNGMGPKQRNKEGETFAKSLKLCEIHSNMLFQKFWVYLQVQNRWARVSFLAQGAGICLFDTYFVQKVICGYSSVKEFILERSKLWLSCILKINDRQYVFSQFTIILRLQCMSLSSNHFPWLLGGIEAFSFIRHS